MSTSELHKAFSLYNKHTHIFIFIYIYFVLQTLPCIIQIALIIPAKPKLNNIDNTIHTSQPPVATGNTADCQPRPLSIPPVSSVLPLSEFLSFVKLLLTLLDFLLDCTGYILNMDSAAAQPVGRDAKRTCPECGKRMSSLTLDSHALCISCRSLDHDLDERCDVCIAWSEEVRKCYCKHRQSL